MSMGGVPGQARRLGARNQKLRAPRSHGLTLSVDDMWGRLSMAIRQIQCHNISQLSYEEHYRYAYNLVLNQQGDMLYAGVRRQVEAHLVRQCAEQLVPYFPLDVAAEQAASAAFTRPNDVGIAAVLGLLPGGGAEQEAVLAAIPTSERFLSAVARVWEDHCSCMGKLRDVLKYVDRVYVANRPELPIWELGLELFRDVVVRSTRVPFHTNLMATLLRQVYCERQGATVERSTIRAISEMLHALTHPQASSAAPRVTVYKKDLEPLLLATAAAYYRAEAQRLLATGQTPFYLQEVERRLGEEEARVAACLGADTQSPLRGVLERELLSDHLDAVLGMPGTGLVPLLEADRREQLDRLYRLFRLVPEGLPALNRVLREYATARGRAINDAAAVAGGAPSAEVALHWVHEVLAFKERVDSVLYTAFQGDKSCETALNEAFDSFINMHPRAPEFISLFIDENLKRGARARTDEEIDEVLDRTITVFRFVHEKDVFERYYKLHLTRRLLHGRSVSDDAERGFVAKLKVECGHGFVQKLQGMLNDMKLSQDVLAAFQRERAAAGAPFQMNVNVLTATYWPISAPEQRCTLPPVLGDACAAFERFYDARHRGRVLTWQPQLGSAEVRVKFRARTHELVVSTYALVVLLLFEQLGEHESLGYGEIRAATNIADGELQRVLQSLACAKYKVLRKEPRGRDVLPTDRFFFNADFTCPLARVKIAQVAAKVETPAERRETTARVEDERKNQVEAYIVRIMKNRKTMEHNDLVNEVIRQLLARFQPAPALIKKRIEALIDKGTSATCARAAMLTIDAPLSRRRPTTDFLEVRAMREPPHCATCPADPHSVPSRETCITT